MLFLKSIEELHIHLVVLHHAHILKLEVTLYLLD